MALPEEMRRKSIVIVGAGISGLAAANVFLNHESAHLLDLRVLEASDRIGGCLHTIRPWGLPLDYGASYIHGTERNPLTKLAQDVDSTFIPRHRSDLRVYYNENGKPASTSESNVVYKKVSEYSDAASQYSRDQSVTVDKTISVGSFYENLITADSELCNETIRRFVAGGVENLSHGAGCDLDQLSLRFYWTEDDLPGDRVFIDSTYDPIVQKIARSALEKKIIQFNTPVNHIEIMPTGVHPIMVKSATANTVYADAVIVTIPLGCLKRNNIIFTPALPRGIQTAISNLGFGVLERFFLRFPRAWWLDAAHQTERNVGVDFYRFPSLTATAEVLPRGMLNFFSLARTHRPQPVLGIFSATKLATHLTSLSKDELKSIFQRYYISNLPNYHAEDPDCEITDVEHSTWSHNLLSGYGAYTHIPVGSDSGIEDLELLSKKIFDTGKGGIWFAGEHATKIQVVDGLKYCNMATVTGAFQSGVRAATEVLGVISD